MNQKHIGIIVIAIGILLSLLIFMEKAKQDDLADAYMKDNGTCYLSDGTCLHDHTSFIFGWVISAALIILGLYLIFFDRLQSKILENQEKISNTLKEAKEIEKKKDEASAFISGFSDDEQKVLNAIRAQEGIRQSTIRFKTNLSKSTVSLIVSSLEKRNIVSRKKSGKTHEVYLVRKF